MKKVKVTLRDVRKELPEGRVVRFWQKERKSGNGQFISYVEGSDNKLAYVQNDEDSSIAMYHISEIEE